MHNGLTWFYSVWLPVNFRYRILVVVAWLFGAPSYLISFSLWTSSVDVHCVVFCWLGLAWVRSSRSGPLGGLGLEMLDIATWGLNGRV